MNPQMIFVALLFTLFTTFVLPQQHLAQEAPVPQGGCVALDKKNPPLFLSYERRDDKAWDGRNYVPGVLLRLNNNSNCVITLTVPPGETREVPPNFGFRNGKWVRLPDVRIGSIPSSATVDLYYLTKYPGDESLYVDGDFHVRDSIPLNNGYHIFFSVPLKNFKRDGRVLVPFNYDSDTDTAPSFIVKQEDGMKRAFVPVKHYLIFERDRLPPEVLK